MTQGSRFRTVFDIFLRVVTYLQWLYGMNFLLKVKAVNPNADDANQIPTKELLYNHLRRVKERHGKMQVKNCVNLDRGIRIYDSGFLFSNVYWGLQGLRRWC